MSVKSIGQRLRELRTSKNVTQDEMAALLNVKRQTYSAYERDVSVPDAYTLNIFSNYFGVTTDYLLGNTDYPYSNISETAALLKKIEQLEAESMAKDKIIKTQSQTITAVQAALAQDIQTEQFLKNLSTLQLAHSPNLAGT